LDPPHRLDVGADSRAVAATEISGLRLCGVMWFALYVLLVLLPATVALGVDPFEGPRPALVEMSTALGLLAFPLLTIQFALVSRLRASSRPFGTDAMVQFHQYVGLLCLLLVIGHPLLLNAQGLPWSIWNPLGSTPALQAGIVAAAAIVAMTVTTAFRRRAGLSYEQWQWLHLSMAVIAVAAALRHVLAVGGYGRAMPLRYLLTAYVVAFGSILVVYRLLRPLGMRRRPWQVTEHRNEGASTRTVRVCPIGHGGFEFEPGQFAWLVTGATPWSSQQHPLSISSSAVRSADRGLEFSIKALGDWSSTVVPQLAPGTRIWVDGPFGAFTIDRRAAQGFVLVAGGIGIAPVRSMLLTMRDRGDRRHVVLFHAAHDETRIIFREELEALRDTVTLDIVYVLEAPAADWTGERGLITEDVLRRHLPAQLHGYGCFVCGPPAMMDATETMLVSLGVPSGSIDTERFHVG